MDNPFEWLSTAIDQVPEFLQPLIVALAGAIPCVGVVHPRPHRAPTRERYLWRSGP